MGLSNRESAAVILLSALLLFGMFRPEVRTSLVTVIKSAANRHILTVVATYLLLMAWVSSVMVRYGFWSWDQWPNLSIWLLFAGFPIVFSVTEAGKQEDLFRNKAKDAMGLSAFVGFIAEVRSFPLWVEILLPIVVIILWFGGYGPAKEQQGRGFFTWALTLVSISVVANSLLWTIGNFSPDWTKEQGASILVVMVWTFVTLTFLFLFSVYAVYQIAFFKFRFAQVTPLLPLWKAKLAVIWAIGADVELANEFKPYWAKRVLQAGSLRIALQQMDEFKYAVHQAVDQRRFQELKLMHNAGVEGVDSSGRQLDQREFKETIEALDWLWTCHAGRYSKNNRYEKETLDIVAMGGFKGLPEEHGILMKISDDGQSWYAYRLTVGGWYFAVGSNGPRSMPRNKWHYDGPEAPSNWPTTNTWDVVPGGNQSKNW
jgi:hypothetical protein